MPFLVLPSIIEKNSLCFFFVRMLIYSFFSAIIILYFLIYLLFSCYICFFKILLWVTRIFPCPLLMVSLSFSIWILMSLWNSGQSLVPLKKFSLKSSNLINGLFQIFVHFHFLLFEEGGVAKTLDSSTTNDLHNWCIIASIVPLYSTLKQISKMELERLLGINNTWDTYVTV